MFPPVYYYLGRAREGLKSPGAADAFKSFLAFRPGDGGPLAADAASACWAASRDGGGPLGPPPRCSRRPTSASSSWPSARYPSLNCSTIS